MNKYTDLHAACVQLAPIISAITVVGGTCYLVGGCVRDCVLGLPIKDIDIEVHGISLTTLTTTLAVFGHVELIGKAFGVVMLAGVAVDWSLPRTDSSGRKPEVAIDPYLGIKEALRRRDVTMNAMAINFTEIVVNYMAYQQQGSVEKFSINACTIIDPFGGCADLAAGIMRAVDETKFPQDPLRFFRVMQFISRFTVQPDERLNVLCRTIVLHDPATGIALARERIFEELKKMILLSNKPSAGLLWLITINRFDALFPFLPQPFVDADGITDLFLKAAQRLDAGAMYCINNGLINTLSDGLRLAYLLALFLATQCTEQQRQDQRLVFACIKKIMAPLTDEHELVRSISMLIAYQDIPVRMVRDNVCGAEYKKIALACSPVISLRQLALFLELIECGQGTVDSHNISKQFLVAAELAGVADNPEQPVLQGRHLLKNIPAGPQLGIVLQYCYAYQIEHSIVDEEQLIAVAIAYWQQINK